MGEEISEPVEARPWRPEHGRAPALSTWPLADPPALWVRAGGRWRWAEVRARQDWPDGRVAYQVLVDLDGSTTMLLRTYWWPQPGLRVARRSASAPSREAGRGGGEMPVSHHSAAAGGIRPSRPAPTGR
ncbi:hypothetical protein L0F81_22270 [Streptomyces tricolor]|uniref:Uncharacterized protein n=1 Tax=Streptomyces tricolor TaxID=68277 RepID=A0ABS9JK89_9ACTN|nr:hypothetical protein [Streptomyces tricolor]MCG0065988.1 hypothetical protein [Streptomyces tricolor]